MFRALSACALLVALVALLGPSPARAQVAVQENAVQSNAPQGKIVGTVVDATTRLPLAHAAVSITGTEAQALKTDANGAFALNVAPGVYVITVSIPGYVSGQSDPATVVAGAETLATIALDRRTTLGNLTEIAHVSSDQQASLRRSTVILKQINGQDLIDAGVFRAGDAIRQLPGVTNAIGDSTAKGDDIRPEIRGFGRLETNQTIDGDPVAVNLSRQSGSALGYNFELTPTVLLDNLNVYYGSGATDLTGVNAIGGVIDMETLRPTRVPHTSFSQGVGTNSEAVSDAQATGTVGRIGYAFAGGIYYNNGPLQGLSQYQPGAAFDASAASPAVRALGVYDTDAAILDRSYLSKFTYQFGTDARATKLTLSVLGTTHYNNKTGNGDNDWLPTSTAMQVGQNDLTSYLKAHPGGCGGNTSQFATKNYNGQPAGKGPDGTPDGAPACESVATFAADNAGPQGTGTSYQHLMLDAYHLRSTTPIGATTLIVDAFTNTYQQDYERPYQLPFVPTPAVPAGNFVYNSAFQYDTDSEFAKAVSTGFTISDSISLGNHDLSAGYFLDNNAYRWSYVGSAAGSSALANPAPAVVSRDTSFLLRDAYHLHDRNRTTLYANENLKHDTATNSSYSDARFSIVTQPSTNDVIRVAAGSTSTQPWAIDLVNTFTPVTDASFVSGIDCSGVGQNSIGSASGTQLTPSAERAFDEELSYSHRFHGEDYVQFTGYNELVYNKILNVLLPLSTLPPGVVNATEIQHFEALAGGCGAGNLTPLAVTGNQNIGFVSGRGYDIAGRKRLSAATYIDYDYSQESAILQSAPNSFLAANLNYILGSQIPGVALHNGSLAFDQRVGQNLEFRLSDYYVGSDNERFAPAYTYANFDSKVNLQHGTIDLAIQNVLNQNSGNYQLVGLGIMQGMNSHATPGNYVSKALKAKLYQQVPVSLFLNFKVNI